ncbi:MAG: hypothetical protein A3F11_04725 [Gammaproteobacteria bacterium RIFCSPHIGHO2_12_FULL_37_14]|nr:MAG: hypothetical protein A3F11_04725 [Gammaproteobacteria bacterium RIFCSPHIGHO2_12_FULL_37_14]
MFKLILCSLIVIALYTTSIATKAQTYFGTFGNNTNKTSPTVQAPQTSQDLLQPIVPTSQDYKSSIEARYQQYQQETANQAKQLLPPPPKVPEISASQTPSLVSPSLPSSAPSVQNVPPPLPSPELPPEAYSVNTPTTTGKPEEQTRQEPVYSGFQGKSPPNAAPKPSTPSGGSGWDINY